MGTVWEELRGLFPTQYTPRQEAASAQVAYYEVTPFQFLLQFCQLSIQDVVNSREVKHKLHQAWKLYCEAQRQERVRDAQSWQDYWKEWYRLVGYDLPEHQRWAQARRITGNA